MRILADQHIHYLDQLIPSYVELVHYDSSEGIPRLEGFDAWILRTVTKVNPKTVPSLPEQLKFIGSASAGTDHIDMEYLRDNGIQFDHSPGCNANAVAEYVLTSMLTWCSLTQGDLTNHKVGIIGMGHTGGALAKKLQAIGVSYAGYDPPKAMREESFRSCHLDTLKDCDILSFHLPYIDQGRHPTHHFMPDILSLSPKHKLIINAARGGIINEDYLLNHNKLQPLSNKKISFVLDVWETEPVPNKALMNQAFIATPHIAGYSKQAKIQASKGVLRRLLSYFDSEWTDSKWQHEQVDSTKTKFGEVSRRGFNKKTNTLSISVLHGLYNYDYEMRRLFNLYGQGTDLDQFNASIARGFQALRNTIKLRNEFAHTTFPKGLSDDLRPIFAQD